MSDAPAPAAVPRGEPEWYEVGGAVRDALLGLPVNDRDWVVVGATPERMVALGFRPVGRDFPVFLHPDTHEEYALARTERKTARGYRGFQVHCAPDVSLEDDLRRRDLTINAIARAADGTLVDPWGGERDLRARVLRHVSDAFAEDPVRILRLARFAARFTDFTVAPETEALMRAMVAHGEVDALVPERVWQELSRGLMETRPSRMVAVLHDCGALERLLPGLEGPRATLAGDVADAAAALGADLPVRAAAFLQALGPADATAGAAPRETAPVPEREAPVRAACERLKAPNDCRDLAVLAARELDGLARAAAAGPSDMVGLLERADALRKPARFEALLRVEQAVRGAARGRTPHPHAHDDRLLRALQAARSVDAGAIATACDPAGGAELIRARLHEARVRAVEAALQPR
jgi:tRNA nucleotidyltransferase (CCA-adding enzyme)